MSAGQLLKQANQLKREGRLDEAIALYHQVIEINPNFAWAYNNLGDGFVKQGNLDEAIVEYQRAIKVNPNSAWFYYQLGEVLAEKGKLDIASVYFQKSINSHIDLCDKLSKCYPEIENNINQVNNFYLFQGQDYGYLTDKPQWVSFPVDENSMYIIEGKIASENAPLSKKALVQFEFFDRNNQKISGYYQGFSNSDDLGLYKYIDIASQSLSKFCIAFKTPPKAFSINIGFRRWHNKRTNNPTIIFESLVKIYFSQLKSLESSVLSSWDYYKLGVICSKKNKLSDALFLCQASFEKNVNFSKCEDKIRELIFKIESSSSVQYWENRYDQGGNSGIGTHNDKLAEFKANVINDLVEKENIESVIEFGCGDSRQLDFAKYPKYIGLDVSKTAINKCKEKFKHDPTKSFFLYDSAYFFDRGTIFSGDLSISIDVLFHLIEDDIYYAYLNHLFGAAKKFVVVYSWNFEDREKFKFHIRPRKFTRDIEQLIQGWKLWKVVNNIYPATELGERKGSFSDFYIYRKS
ncbi:MAG: tetratricopeptide repeat protein [Okeania sp. SIO2C9]|uniref:tetratricopeptide repeat protein n=1 Tax=Okeania sp. SIO2C9 TaxID=2607791 RepID=UPI0013C10BFE|nr:tetratricopeptide repeat protein [Okeania sp. SIO2C9]NEQ71635.1 tetratricopeptide repeat protein [Okeania sp. SIO2C9]